MLSTVHVITFLPLFVSFVCRFSIFLGSLCLEHCLDCNPNKRSQGEAMTGATSKRPRQNREPSQPTIFASVRSAVSSVDLSTSSPSFNSDLISRLADAVTQRLRQENQPSLTALQSADTPVMEIPATIPFHSSMSPKSFPSCFSLPSWQYCVVVV